MCCGIKIANENKSIGIIPVYAPVGIRSGFL